MAGAAALMLLAACAFNVPSGTITGVIESSRELSGSACPIPVTGSDGERWEVTLPDGYIMDIVPEGDEPGSGLIGPHGEVIAPQNCAGRPEPIFNVSSGG